MKLATMYQHLIGCPWSASLSLSLSHRLGWLFFASSFTTISIWILIKYFRRHTIHVFDIIIYVSFKFSQIIPLAVICTIENLPSKVNICSWARQLRGKKMIKKKNIETHTKRKTEKTKTKTQSGYEQILLKFKPKTFSNDIKMIIEKCMSW